MRTSVAPALVAALLMLVVGHSAASQEKLTPRDVFWSASDLISVTPNPATKKAQTHAKSSNTKPTTSKPDVTVANSVDTVEKPVATAGPKHTQAQMLRVSANGYGAPPRLVSETQDRLGLRCSIMLRDPDLSFHEVSRDHVFHSGDRIRLGLLGNHSGYFYVIQQGSSGEWSAVYPRPANTTDINRIEAGSLETTRTFQFDQTPGQEHVFILFSRTQIADIDKSIQGFQQATPSSTPHPVDNAAVMEASNRIPDAFVQKISSRDLKLVDEQTVSDSTTSKEQSGEQAVYVVAKADVSKANQEVVLSLTLRHE